MSIACVKTLGRSLSLDLDLWVATSCLWGRNAWLALPLLKYRSDHQDAQNLIGLLAINSSITKCRPFRLGYPPRKELYREWSVPPI